MVRKFSGDQGTSSQGGSNGVSEGGIGAMFSRNNQDSTPISNSSISPTMYGVGVGVGVGGDGAASSGQRSSIAFDPSYYKSWGGFSMGGDMTASQRQEFERQKLIFKHMAASMPVPPELLLHMTSKFPSQLQLSSYCSNDHGSRSGRSRFDLRHATGSRDSEPWRCRRTDGKKWRCAREVAPDQKYCERHCNRGRRCRSRKHVEASLTSSSSSSTTISITNASNNNTFIQSSSPSAANIIKPSFLFQPSQSMLMSQAQHPQNPSENRLPDWFMQREAHYHDLGHDGSTASPFFLPHSTEVVPFSRAADTSAFPRQFLDEWSLGPKPDAVIEMTGKPMSDSSLLTLSMAGGSGDLNSEDEAAQFGQRHTWMGSGGPLAEALGLGIVGRDAGKTRGSHHGYGEQ